MRSILLFLLLALAACGRGPKGDIGITGQQGNPGVNGVDASPFYPIQLCSSCTAHYPDTFPEVVFCYQGNFYGTYSANGGFSAPLPAGQYSSNGINCSCTITLSPNCVVQS